MNYSETKGRVERPIIPKICAGVVLISLISLIATWWFVLFNPSPVPAAKTYMTTRLQEVARGLAVSPMAGKMKLEIGDVKDTRVKGDTAEVSIDMKITYMGENGTGPTRVALKKQGSILKKGWQVDVIQSNQLQTGDMFGIIMKMIPGMIKKGIKLPGVGGQGVPPSVTMPNRNR